MFEIGKIDMPPADIDSLTYWKDRGGQIEWRLADAQETVKQMKRDLKECDEMIKKLSTKTSEGV